MLGRIGTLAAMGGVLAATCCDPALAATKAGLGGGLQELLASYENHSATLATQLKLHLSDEASAPLVRIRLSPGKTAAAILAMVWSMPRRRCL